MSSVFLVFDLRRVGIAIASARREVSQSSQAVHKSIALVLPIIVLFFLHTVQVVDADRRAQLGPRN